MRKIHVLTTEAKEALVLRLEAGEVVLSLAKEAGGFPGGFRDFAGFRGVDSNSKRNTVFFSDLVRGFEVEAFAGPMV